MQKQIVDKSPVVRQGSGLMETTLHERFYLANIMSPDFIAIQNNIRTRHGELEKVIEAADFEYPGPFNTDEGQRDKTPSARERARLFACAAGEARLLVLALDHATSYHEFLALEETSITLVRDSLAKLKQHAAVYLKEKQLA